MAETSAPLLSVSWVGPASTAGVVKMLDQRGLPLSIAYVDCATVEAVHAAIFDMTVRGAPAIGAAGGYGMALAAFQAAAVATSGADMLARLQAAKAYLDSSRPTAVNLEWATKRIVELAAMFADSAAPQLIAELVLTEANDLAEEDVRINRALGAHGNAVVPAKANILHHCNTGSLATVGHGTAIGVIYSAHEAGKDVHVWIDETRPRLQGAKLTAFELMQAGVKVHLNVDNAAAHLMGAGKVDVVLFGADRVAANGDVANKIGTMQVCICARELGVPAYACVPTPTIDLTVASGRDIVIEERSSTEVTHIGAEQIAPTGVPVFNPAFDVTPYKYLTGIVTEEGVCYPPFAVSLKAAKEKAEARVRARWEEKVAQYKQDVAAKQQQQQQ